MLVDDAKCMCNKCMRSSYCETQRSVVYVQRVVSQMYPDVATVAIFVARCQIFTPKESPDGHLEHPDTTAPG